MKKNELTPAEINHLRRLVSWTRCEIGQEPDEHIAMVRDIVPKLGGISDDAKQRFVEHHEKLVRVPAYIRAAVKALTKTYRRCDEKEPPDAEEVGAPSLPPTTRALEGPK